MRLKLALALVVVAGCHHRLPKLAEQGRHAEVVRRAESSRIRPRKRAARAYAQSLYALGQEQRALDTLQLDYRRGGDIRSLVAMADLERDLGWRGLAAHHYVRVLTLDRDALAGQAPVCELFRERARAYLHSGEGEAADADMRRVAYLCPQAGPGDAQLRARADTAAQAQVDARIATGRCTAPCQPPRSLQDQALEDAIAGASQPSDWVRISDRFRVEIPPAAIVDALVADLRGELGSTVIDDDTVRAWVGDQTWSDLAPTVMSSDGSVAAYVQLRLAGIVDGLPQAPGAGATRELDRWTEQAARVPGAQGWRVYGSQGDISTAELQLASVWRPARPKAGEPASELPPRSPLGHWSARLPITSETLRPALVAARLRAAAGKHDLALELERRALSAARAQGLADTELRTQEEVLRALGWGRPWHALALLDTGGVAEPAPLRAAASTAIVMSRAMCGGPCRDDEDLGVVMRVMGDAWIEQTTQQLTDWSLAHATRVGDAGRCPTVAEVLAPDAVGPLPDALRAARDDLHGPGVGDGLAVAIVSDVRAWCAGRLALPAMAHGGHVLPAARLAETLAHVPEMSAARDLVVHAKLAMIASEGDRAELLAVAAAAASIDPKAVWVDLAMFAADTKTRELELRAWREALMATATARDPSIEQRMVVVALGDVAVSWGQDGPAGIETTRRHVTSALERAPLGGRWWASEALIAAATEANVTAAMTAEQRQRVVDALAGSPDELATHARALARLRGEDPGPGRGPMHPSGLADDAKHGRISDISAVTTAMGDPMAFERTRIALARHARDWSVRRRMAASLLAMGSRPGRVAGWESLTAMAARGDRGQRAALESLLLQRPAALEPGAPVGTGSANADGGVPKGTSTAVGPGPVRRAVSATVAIEDEALLLRVVLGLDFPAVLVAP